MAKTTKVLGQYAVWGAALALGVGVFELTYDAFSAGRKVIRTKLEKKAAEVETEEKTPETEDTVEE